jgi:hypothetical protein
VKELSRRRKKAAYGLFLVRQAFEKARNGNNAAGTGLDVEISRALTKRGTPGYFGGDSTQ